MNRVLASLLAPVLGLLPGCARSADDVSAAEASKMVESRRGDRDFSETLDWLASLRLHPVNDFLTRLAQAVPVLLLGFNPEVLAFLLPFLAFHGLLLHSTVGWDFGAVGKVVSSPAFHRWHHTSEEEGLNRNFGGILVVWDRLFGTYYMPQGRRASRFGVLGEPVPDGLWAQLKYPFSA